MEPEQKGSGATIGIVVVVILLIIGGYITWQNSVKQKALDEQNKIELETLINDTAIDAELDALNQDLNSTGTDVNVNLDTLQ